MAALIPALRANDRPLRGSLTRQTLIGDDTANACTQADVPSSEELSTTISSTEPGQTRPAAETTDVRQSLSACSRFRVQIITLNTGWIGGTVMKVPIRPANRHSQPASI